MASDTHTPAKIIALDCIVCGVEFTFPKPRVGRYRRFCSDECRSGHIQRRVTPTQCGYCGVEFRPSYLPKKVEDRLGGIRFCSIKCHRQSVRRYKTPQDKARAKSFRRRARKYSAPYERILDREIFERDGWVCGICHGKVDRRLRPPHPARASLDHIVPLAKGGSHTRSNVQCSHWICNSRKGDRGGGQLLLFG